ncbi:MULTISPECIES: YcjF family protein [unclassified Prochlorococcus]|uniref:YcjF family protein n=1 Tax=unclassified Prochlorococcus TaxID=2627481 RepID=UPI000533A225|nr:MULTISPECIES: YcjF family protein [unclassified Prochlorococcus]KGG15387.1 Membrane associated GTPase [Prochlorococcus sp. MIT 0602]KGG17665.1 Membrane associated GTPase [Prochlorococcus sp. MIT 0603]
MKNPISTLTQKFLPVGKIGFVFGSLIAGEWVLNDLVHIPSSGMALIAAGAGVWIFSKTSSSSFKAPESVKGWVKRCKSVLNQFEALEDSSVHFQKTSERTNALQSILSREEPQSISVISTEGVDLPDIDSIKSATFSSNDFNLSLSSSLPINNETWELPNKIFEKDLIIYYLPVPLRAVDLIWLERLPADLASWILISIEDSAQWSNQYKALQSQLPDRWTNRILKWDKSNEDLRNVLSPVRRCLNQPKRNIDFTRQRLLSRLHSEWQSDLEILRRQEFRNIQNRSQWLVAGAVFASPVPSTDLLSVAVVNGLMIQEMRGLWSCDIKPELLNAVARQLAIAALAQGVVEWSGQALLGVAKLHGGTWLAAGAMQALSAAYMTRVVGTSMADWMALNNGVTQPDLELLKIQAPQLIANAAEKEKVDWSRFVDQSKNWIAEQVSNDSNQIKPKFS